MTSRQEAQASVMAAVKDAKRGRRKERNPLHRPDPQRDRGTSFTSQCQQLADADLEDIARWHGTDFDRQRLLEQARRAHQTLERFLALCGGGEALREWSMSNSRNAPGEAPSDGEALQSARQRGICNALRTWVPGVPLVGSESWFRNLTGHKDKRSCMMCGANMSRDWGRRFCSNACRQKAYRLRRRQGAEVTP